MWTRLSAWKRRQLLLIAAVCVPLAAWLGLRGEYTMAALLGLVPLLGFVETWGEVNPTRRTRGYWTVLGIIVTRVRAPARDPLDDSVAERELSFKCAA